MTVHIIEKKSEEKNEKKNEKKQNMNGNRQATGLLFGECVGARPNPTLIFFGMYDFTPSFYEFHELHSGRLV